MTLISVSNNGFLPTVADREVWHVRRSSGARGRCDSSCHWQAEQAKTRARMRTRPPPQLAWRPQETSPSEGDRPYVDHGIVENAIEVGREASDRPTRKTAAGRSRWGLTAMSGRSRPSRWLVPAPTPRPGRRHCRHRRRRTSLWNCYRTERLSIDAKKACRIERGRRRRACPIGRPPGQCRRRRSPMTSTTPEAPSASLARSFARLPRRKAPMFQFETVEFEKDSLVVCGRG